MECLGFQRVFYCWFSELEFYVNSIPNIETTYLKEFILVYNSNYIDDLCCDCGSMTKTVCDTRF